MADVKKLFQKSENILKPECIFGHLFGAVGRLAGNALLPSDCVRRKAEKHIARVVL